MGGLLRLVVGLGVVLVVVAAVVLPLPPPIVGLILLAGLALAVALWLLT